MAFQKPSAPPAEGRLADRQVGTNLDPTLLDVDEEFAPALCALPHPGLEADQFVLAFGGRTDQHEHAFRGRFHPGLQVDPVRPHVYVSPGRELAILPGIVIRLPFRGQPRLDRAMRPMAVTHDAVATIR